MEDKYALDFGEGAINVLGKLMLADQPPVNMKDPTDPKGEKLVDLKRTLVGGLLIGDLTTPLPEKSSPEEDIDLAWEMWEVEMIIRPRRKYRGTNEGYESFGDLRLDQILTSDWVDRKRYKYQIFPSVK